MFRENLPAILSKIAPGSVVVDIGGWAQPFTRSNYVIDLMPYQTRGIFGRVGPEQEHFTSETWLKLDVCTDPLPFADKSVDYLLCSHTLEDLRDPVRVCREINRVAKAGYIEVPSRAMESIWRLEHPGYPGYYHHHWLVEVDPDQRLTFRFKTPLMSSSWKYVLPHSYLRRLPERERVTWLFWDGRLDCRELVQLSEESVAAELEGFVRARHAYAPWRYQLEKLRPDVRQRAKRFLKRSTRLRPLANRLLGRELTVADEGKFWAEIPAHDSRYGPRP